MIENLPTIDLVSGKGPSVMEPSVATILARCRMIPQPKIHIPATLPDGPPRAPRHRRMASPAEVPVEQLFFVSAPRAIRYFSECALVMMSFELYTGIVLNTDDDGRVSDELV